MNWVQVQNRDGVWVAPDDETFKAAAANATWDKTFYQRKGAELPSPEW